MTISEVIKEQVEEFDKEFGVNQPPMISPNTLIEAQRVRSFLYSSMQKAAEAACGEVDDSTFYNDIVDDPKDLDEKTYHWWMGWNAARSAAIEAAKKFMEG